MVDLWKLCPNCHVLTRCHHNLIYPLCDFSPARVPEETPTPDSRAPAPQIRTRRVTRPAPSALKAKLRYSSSSSNTPRHTHQSVAHHVRTPNCQFLMHCHHNNIILSAATRLSITSSIQLLPMVIMSTSSFIVSQIPPCQASSSLTADHI